MVPGWTFSEDPVLQNCHSITDLQYNLTWCQGRSLLITSVKVSIFPSFSVPVGGSGGGCMLILINV